MDPRIFEIVSAKPELVDTFPRWMLSETTENELKNTEGLAIVEIAGRDSIAAALEAVKERDFKAFLPTIVYTGTEFGSWKVTFEKVDMLREVLSKRGVKIFDPIVLGAPRFWWRLCGRYITHLFESFGFYSPCVGCHLYLHAIRIPLARKIECGVMIAGERESHEGKIKINQIGVALDAYISFAEKFGVELFLPLRQVSKSKDIESIISQHWEESGEQLECVLSKNYQDIGGNVVYSEGDIRRFFDEFALKEAEDTIKKFLSFHDS
jgi:hypothetical protein